MTKLKTVNIKGKEYVEVHTRIKEFHNQYKNGSLTSSFERIELDGDALWIVKATATPDVSNPDRFFTGHAQELESQGYINKTSALENAETSAWGRALGSLDIGLTDSVATADEVNKAISRDKATPQAKLSKDMWLVAVNFGTEHNEAIKNIPGRKWIPGKKLWAVPINEDNRHALFVMKTKKGIKDVFDMNGEKVSIDMTKEQEADLRKETFDKPF